MDFFANYYQYYYAVLILQAICVFHSLKRGTQAKWIWIIVFLPLIGSVAYLYAEVIRRSDVNSVVGGVSSMINPSGKIKDLENRFKFSETFANRMALANAYFEKRDFIKAIEYYEPLLTGILGQSEDVIKNLVYSYFQVGRYEDLIRIAPKVLDTFDFTHSQANLCYAMALEELGKFELAEAEFIKMNHRFSNYESRYKFGDFLTRRNRREEAIKIFKDIINESEHLNRRERNAAIAWIDKAKQQVKKLSAQGA